MGKSMFLGLAGLIVALGSMVALSSVEGSEPDESGLFRGEEGDGFFVFQEKQDPKAKIKSSSQGKSKSKNPKSIGKGSSKKGSSASGKSKIKSKSLKGISKGSSRKGSAKNAKAKNSQSKNAKGRNPQSKRSQGKTGKAGQPKGQSKKSQPKIDSGKKSKKSTAFDDAVVPNVSEAAAELVARSQTIAFFEARSIEMRA